MSEMSELSSDFWLENANLRQPKREVADYVESQGILVPRRFDSLEEAMFHVRDHGTILLRSEHPDEYDGPSDLLGSYRVDSERITRGRVELAEIENALGRWNLDIDNEIPKWLRNPASYSNPKRPGFKAPGSSQVLGIILGGLDNRDPQIVLDRLSEFQKHSSPVNYYSGVKGLTPDQLMADASFSFWEYKPGINLTVVADDAIDGQYHTFAKSDRLYHTKGYEGYIGKENGELVRHHGRLKAKDWVLGELLSLEQRGEIASLYETIRNLPRFASDHCPIIELQMDVVGSLYFLQYHRSRDFSAAGDKLNPSDFSPEEGWVAADAVRGSISSPSTLKMSLAYPDYYGDASRGIALPEVEEAAAKNEDSFALIDEMLVRRRLGDISTGGFNRLYGGMLTSHGNRSRWFKPQTSINLARDEKVVDADTWVGVVDNVWRKKRMMRLVIDLASDGRTGFYRLNPDSEQPVYTDS